MRYSSRLFLLLIPFVFFAAPGASSQEELPVLEGIMEAKETVEISSQSPGIIDEIVVERGAQVKKGDVLVKLKSAVEKAAVELAKAHVEFNTRKLQRSEELSRKRLISPHEKDELETELEIRKLELQEATEILNMKTITSPVQGIILDRNSSPGEYVGENITIMTIVQIDPLYVEIVAPVELFGKIKKGLPAIIRPEAPISGEYKAKVTIVDQVIDAASGTFGIRLELPNPSLRLPAGLKCKIKFSGN